MIKAPIITQRRKKYLHDKTRDVAADTEAHISKLLSKENFAIFSDLNINHQNVLIKTLSRQEILYNLKTFMFYRKEIPGNMPTFIDNIYCVHARYFKWYTVSIHDCHIYTI